MIKFLFCILFFSIFVLSFGILLALIKEIYIKTNKINSIIINIENISMTVLSKDCFRFFDIIYIYKVYLVNEKENMKKNLYGFLYFNNLNEKETITMQIIKYKNIYNDKITKEIAFATDNDYKKLNKKKINTNK